MEFNKIELSEKQAEAAFHPEGPLLIAAGAGSGKTKTLTSRLLFLLENGAKPEEIIAITFTNKAAKEMADRAAKSLEKIAGGKTQNKPLPAASRSPFIIRSLPFIGTFHSLGARILRSECSALGRSIGFSIFDDDDTARLVRRITKAMNIGPKRRGMEKFGPAYFARKISNIKNEVSAPEEGTEEDELACAVFKEYEQELQKNNAFDFDDLIEKPVRIFRARPDILEKYRNRFRYVLVDEYQDINNAQYLFIKLLAEKHRNLSVVGDDSQAIYSFRGANFRNFLNFERDWPSAKIVLLEENYRSTANIIEAASALIANNVFQKQKKLWTKNEAGEMIDISEHESPEDESLFISQTIRALERNGDAGSIAILYRTNAQSRAIEQALIEKNIPYRIFGGMRFYDRKEIKDIVAGLRYAANPADTVSLERLEKNFLKRHYLDLREKLPEYARSHSPADLIGFIVSTTNYFEYIAKNYPNAAERAQNIHELIRFAEQFKDLSAFLEQISLTQSADNPSGSLFGNRQPIHLMTVHLAKGLEFDTVFIAGAGEGLIPHQMSFGKNDDIEEERRLMYVAMTRARKKLYISFYDIPSRFLSEIPPQLTHFSGNRGFDDEERWIEIE